MDQLETYKSKTIVGILPLYYLPSIAYFEQLIHWSILYLEAHETFQKQTLRNRCVLFNGKQPLELTIPIQSGRSHTPIQSTKIDYSQSWRRTHLGAIQACYGKKPFFDSFYGDIESILGKQITYLWDLNYDFLTLLMKTLRVDLTVSYTDDYGVIPILPFTQDHSGSAVNSDGIGQNVDTIYSKKTGREIVHNLSIIDLIFHYGPEAYAFLPMKKSSKGNQI
ncbi:MAG: WbqC family protein [Cytophagaceae bacterium]|jgi:hypothetical protein|nr:WbqC family protein [Cytophagaceae bacterium]